MTRRWPLPTHRDSPQLPLMSKRRANPSRGKSSAASSNAPEVVAGDSHLQLVKRGGWIYAHRPNATGVVAVVALTGEGELIFVEQFRPPVQCPVIEFPAGLAGDIAGEDQESLASAARRELWEETGYRARHVKRLFTGASSAGMTDETMTFFLARGLRREHDGGGVGNERITVHHIARDRARRWLERSAERGSLVDARVYAGLYFLDQTVPPEE